MNVVGIQAVRVCDDRPSSRNPLSTSPMMHRLWWLLIALLHSVNLVYYTVVAALYRQLPSTNLRFQLDTYGIGIANSEYMNIAVIHAIFAVIHGILLITMLSCSIMNRRLVYRPQSEIVFENRAINAVQSCFRCFDSKRINSISSTISRGSSAIFSRDGLLGVNSRYFDDVHVVRELVETCLQTIQAFRMTHHLARRWLIRLYVTLLILNCWSTPILHYFYFENDVKRRFLSRVSDLVLDVFASVGVAVVIFCTYAPQYNDPRFGFPFEIWFHDEWYTNMQQEFQMMLIVSWSDMVSRVVLGLGLLQCMESIKSMLSVPSGPKRTSIQPLSVVLHQQPCTNYNQWDRITIMDQSGVRRDHLRRYIGAVARILFVIWGIFILMVHVVAELRHEFVSLEIPCALQLRPWFVWMPACSLVELNCRRQPFNGGNAVVMADAWNTFSYGSIARLVIRHCPHLVMPSTFQKLYRINSLKIYNCTISSWTEVAAVSARAHQELRVIFLIRTQFMDGTLPADLLDPVLPTLLGSIITSATNLRTLPETLDETWHSGMRLTFELSELTEISSPLIRLTPAVISLSGSLIQSVSAAVFENPVLECIMLAYTNVSRFHDMYDTLE